MFSPFIGAKAAAEVVLRNNLGWFVTGAEVAANRIFHQTFGHERVIDQQANLADRLVDHIIRLVLLGQGEAELGRHVALVEVDEHEVDTTGVELRLVGEALELGADSLRPVVAIGHDESRQTRLQNQSVDVSGSDVIDRRLDLEEASDFSTQPIARNRMNRFFHAALYVFDRADHERVGIDQHEIRTMIPGRVEADVAPGLGILGLVQAIELDSADVVVAVAGDDFELSGLSTAAFFARIGDDDSPVTLLEQKLFGVGVGQLVELENGFDIGQRRRRGGVALVGVGARGSLSATGEHGGGGQNDEAHDGVFKTRHRGSFQIFMVY